MKQIAVLSVLLGAALVGTYVTLHADEADAAKADQVPMFRADPSDLQAIDWKSDTSTVHVERKLDAAGEYLWVTVTEVPPAPEGETPEPAAAGEALSFKGNDTSEKLWKDFAPLYALRQLAATDTSSFGFDAPTATIEIARKAGPLSLVVGGETYGSKDRYVKVEDRVFLVDDQALKPLELAKTRLVDRTLQPLADADIEKVTVSRSEAAGPPVSVTLLHKNAEDRAAAFWARSDAPAEANEAAKTWLGKVMRLRSQEYAKTEPTLAPAFTITVEGKGQAWTVELLTGDDAQYYARSSYTRGLVLLTESVASEVVADADTVLSPG